MPKVRLSPACQTLKPSATLAAAAKAKQLKSQGLRVYDFTLGEPDFATPFHIRQAAIAAMEAGHTHYTPSGGIPELRRAVCEYYYREYGLQFEPKQVLISNGAKHSLHNVLAALCGPGDEVIIPTPYWVSYSALVELTGATPVLVPTTEESDFILTPDQLTQRISPRTRLLMLNNPCNPTGTVYSRAQLLQLAQAAVAHDLWILSDEIYEKLVYSGSEFYCLATLGRDIAEKTILVSGVSKAYAMTGWRIGWTVGPAELITAMDNLQSQETSNPCSISQYAALAALTGPQECVVQMREEFEWRRQYLLQRLQTWRDRFGITFALPRGAFYGFFNVSPLFEKPLRGGRVVRNSADLCTALLEEVQVALVTGDAFGAPGYVRLSFATDRETLQRGCDLLESFFAG